MSPNGNLLFSGSRTGSLSVWSNNKRGQTSDEESPFTGDYRRCSNINATGGKGPVSCMVLDPFLASWVATAGTGGAKGMAWMR